MTPPALLGTFNSGFLIARGLATVLLMNGVGLWVKGYSGLFCPPLKFDYMSGYLYLFGCGLLGCFLASYVGVQRRRGKLPTIEFAGSGSKSALPQLHGSCGHCECPKNQSACFETL